MLEAIECRCVNLQEMAVLFCDNTHIITISKTVEII